MYFGTVTQKELNALPLPKTRWRLDHLLKARRDTETGKTLRGFETLDACWEEDQRRARALRQVPDEFKAAFGCNADDLADTLERGAKEKVVPYSCASAAYMRAQRLAFLGALMELISDNPDLELEFVSVAQDKWCLDYRSDLAELHDKVRGEFRSLLNSVRMWDFPGFLVACVNGQFDVQGQRIQLVFNGLYAGEKRRAARIWDNDDHPFRALDAIMAEVITDLPQQLCELIPNRVVEGTPDFVKVKDTRRMREPYHSLYLMWLAHCSLADRMLLDDISVKATGLALERTPTYWWEPEY